MNNASKIILQFVVVKGLVILIRRRSRAVQLASDGVSHTGELLLLLLEVLHGSGGGVVLEPVVDLLNGVEDGLLVILIDLATQTILVVDLVLQAEGVVLKTVTGLDLALDGLVLLGVLLGLLDHAVDLLLGETALVVGDGDGLSLASALVGGADLEDSIGIEVKGDLDLGNTTGGGRDVGQLELAEHVVVLGHRALTLEHLDQDGGLVVGGSRENLRLAGRDDSVAGDELGHNTASGLDTESEGVDIHENDINHRVIAGENTTLNGGTEGNGLIGVDTLAGLLTGEELLEKSLNLGDTGRTTNKNDVINLGLLDLSVLENLLNRLEGLLEQINVKLLELSAGKSLREVLAVVEGLDFNASRHLGRESTLGLLNLALKLTHSLKILLNIGVVLLVVLLDEVLHDTVVEILTTKVSVTSGSQDLENAVVNRQKRHIESTTTKIVNNDLALVTGLIKTVGDSGGGGLVDNTEDVETGDSTGILGSLTLGVAEVGGNGNNGVGDSLAQEALGDLLHLTEDHGGNLLRGEGLGGLVDVDLDLGLAILLDNLEGVVLDVLLDVLVIELATNHTLDVEDSALGVGGILVLGGVTNEALLIGEGNVRRGNTVSLVVDKNLDLAVLHHTNTRVSGSQINTNNIPVALGGVLLLSVGSVSKERQRRDEDEEEVEDGGPGEGLGRAIACG